MTDDAANSQTPSPLPGFLRWSGPVLSYCYGVGASLHRTLTKPQRAPLPVLSIGNISVGGTGKTPAVKYFAQGLAQRGFKPAVLMRGYKNQGSDEAREVEAALAVAQIPVLVGSDRVANAARAHASGRDVVLLDDGFQHWRLARELDIVLVDATNPFGGLLREQPAALERASVVLLTRADTVSAEDLAALEARVKKIVPAAIVARASHRAVALTGLDGAAHRLDELRGKRVHALCGIGNPEGFFRTLRGLGAALAGTSALADHATYTAAEFERIVRGAVKPIVTTDKDAVKLKALSSSADIWSLSVQFTIHSHEAEIWQHVEQALRLRNEQTR